MNLNNYIESYTEYAHYIDLSENSINTYMDNGEICIEVQPLDDGAVAFWYLSTELKKRTYGMG